MTMETQGRQSEKESNPLDYLIVVLKNKKIIFKATFGSMALAAVISFLIPSTYVAETRILPPQTFNSSMGTYFSQLGGMGVSGLAVKTPNDLYVNLLRSRSVLDYVTETQGLAKVYGTQSPESLRNILSRDVMIRDDKKSGVITIAYEHRKPQVAADVANAFVSGLQSLNNNLAVTEASQRRLFFETQLNIAKESLIKSEEGLKGFQQRTGTMKIDEQLKAAMEETAQIRAKISAKEVQLRVMKTYATPENPELQQLQDEILALKDQLVKLGYKGDEDDSLLSARKISVYGTEYLRKMREFKYNESLYEILVKQYEVAKLDESKNASLVQIIDKAIPPEKRASPNRKHLVLNAGWVVFFLAVFFVFARVFFDNLLLNPDYNAKWDEIRKDIVTDSKTILDMLMSVLEFLRAKMRK